MKGTAVETEVPLEAEGGTYVVPVSINDTIVLKFTIDSGASDVSIPADVASTLIRSGTITRDDFIGQRTYTLADGTQVPSPVFRIRTLKVGTLVLHDVTASVADPKGALLLGQSFLSRLSTWSIDNQRHALLLKAAPGEAQAAEVTPSVPNPFAAMRTEAAASATGEQSDLQLGAAKRAMDYFAAWSDPSDPDGASIGTFYWSTVRFYGKDIPLNDLMSQKLAFARRWPSRAYVARSASMTVTCSDEHLCTVTGVVDWRASNDGVGRRSTGVATFAMGLRDGLIVSEAGSVLARQPG